jgi:hypothetical protein
MTYTVKTDTTEVMDMLTHLPIELRDKAMAMAINKTADKAKTEMKKQITAVFNLKASEVSGALHVSGAKWKNGVTMHASLYPSTIGGSGRAMNVVHFLQGTSKGELVFLFKKSGGNKIIGPGPAGESRPFIGNTSKTVFRRVGPGRLPIEPVQVIDVPQMFNTKVLNEAVLAKAADDLVVEAGYAVNYLLSKLK